MKLEKAIALINGDYLSIVEKTTWADLGCGKGTFTLALASLLNPGSTIYAVDVNSEDQADIPGMHNGVTIKKYKADFVKEPLSFKDLDGILMANSFHYVKDQYAFILRASKWIKKNGCFLLVEYDTDKSSRWVPYPLGFSSLQNLFHKAGFPIVKKLSSQSSVFGSAKLYAVVIGK